MKLIEIANSHANLNLSLDELIKLSNVINEICYGVDMSDDEIAIRVGESHKSITLLLTQLLDVIKKIEENEKAEPTFKDKNQAWWAKSASSF